MAYIAGCVDYSLNDNENTTPQKICLAGIETTIKFYVKNQYDYPKIEAMTKYLEMRENGELEKHINEHYEQRADID